MTRKCSAQDKVRTPLSPPWRATIRANVVQGRNSISCANSVLPAYIGESSPKNGRGQSRSVQVDTTENCRKALIGQSVPRRRASANRTAVKMEIKTAFSREADISEGASSDNQLNLFGF